MFWQSLNILANGDIVGVYDNMFDVVIKHDKLTGALTSYLNIGANYLWTFSVYENNLLAAGNRQIEYTDLKWVITDSTNNPILWCNATFFVRGYWVYSSQMIGPAEYII